MLAFPNAPAPPSARRYADQQTAVELQPGQCELRFQPLVEPSKGWPPSLISKGKDLPFSAGSPLAVTGPEIEGYTRYLGGSLFGQPGYDCPGTIK